jgi:hypothetical protein
MGTRINVLYDHGVADFRDSETVLAKLERPSEAALAVREYWHRADPSSLADSLLSWRAEAAIAGEPHLRHYTGPGHLFLTLTPCAARVHTGGRWRGFLSIEPLRCVHLCAFRDVGRALEASCMALYADSCEVDDLFWDGRSQRDCLELMERMWGPPQCSVAVIDRRVAASAEHTVPSVWFLENVHPGT